VKAVAALLASNIGSSTVDYSTSWWWVREAADGITVATVELVASKAAA
jgi:hypothetical protein